MENIALIRRIDEGTLLFLCEHYLGSDFQHFWTQAAIFMNCLSIKSLTGRIFLYNYYPKKIFFGLGGGEGEVSQFTILCILSSFLFFFLSFPPPPPPPSVSHTHTESLHLLFYVCPKTNSELALSANFSVSVPVCFPPSLFLSFICLPLFSAPSLPIGVSFSAIKNASNLKKPRQPHRFND